MNKCKLLAGGGWEETNLAAMAGFVAGAYSSVLQLNLSHF